MYITINTGVLVYNQPNQCTIYLLCFICGNNKLLIDFVNSYIIYIIKKLKTYDYVK